MSVLLLGVILGGGTWISRMAAGSGDGNVQAGSADTEATAHIRALPTDTAAVIADSARLENNNIQ